MTSLMMSVSATSNLEQIPLDPITAGETLSAMSVASLLGACVILLLIVITIMTRYFLNVIYRKDEKIDVLQDDKIRIKDEQHEKLMEIVSDLNKAINENTLEQKEVIKAMEAHQKLLEDSITVSRTTQENIKESIAVFKAMQTPP